MADPLPALEAEATQRFITRFTIPLLLDGKPDPAILGTGTLFQAEGRAFVVTADHILREDPDDPSSEIIDLADIAFPSRLVDATLQTFGEMQVLRPRATSGVDIDVAVFELKSPDTINLLTKNWGFLSLAQVGRPAAGDRFILSGYPFEGVHLKGDIIQQSMLHISTDPLHDSPQVEKPVPQLDQFYYLEAEGELIDGSKRTIPRLEGLSGASIWAYAPPRDGLFWTPATALRVVGVQSSAKRGQWFRGADWAAVRSVLGKPEVGLVHAQTAEP